MSSLADSNSPKSSQSSQMNPSVQPFYLREASTASRPRFAQRPPQPMNSTRPAFPSYPSERLDIYQQAVNGIHWAFPPSPDMNRPTAPNDSPEALIADMWKSCPALCASIRQDFDLSAIFHPALIALHGETFLRLAASQIAIQNQAAEMTDMRHALSQKQTLLDVNTTSAKDLQTKLVSQQSELKEIRGLLGQQLQSLTSSDVTGNQQTQHSCSQRSSSVSRGVNISPMSSASTLTAANDTTKQFYALSASLSPLKLNLASDNIEKHVEKHGYGHAETKGPSLRYGLESRGGSSHDTGQVCDQPSSVPPTVSTSAIFELAPSSAVPIVSIVAKPRIAHAAGHFEGYLDAGDEDIEHQPSTLAKATTSADIKIVKRKLGVESGSENTSKSVEEMKSEPSERENNTLPTTPLKSDFAGTAIHEKASPSLSSKPVSYAAAARTTPATPSEELVASTKPSATVSQNSSALDLGFTLEPLPKPTVQQIQSQQQLPEATSTIPDAESAPFDFEEWKQQKITEGTWEDRPRRPKSHLPHLASQRSYHPMYRGRGSRPGYQDNFRHGVMSEAARKRDWLAWKQNLVSQGRWNPAHPFREAWKNE